MSDRSLIIGGSGMVGQNIHFGIKPRSSDLNILDEKSISNYLDLIETPDCIIHLAALNIRDCEKSPSKAIKINIDGTINMLNVAKKLNIPFIFFSSGAVFSSKLSTTIFNEEMSTSPNCIYGDTKNSAELIVKSYEKSIIIRTGWLFGGIQKTHNKFVELVLNSLLTNTSVKGSEDFFGSPTYCSDIILKMVDLIHRSAYGIHHIVNTGLASGYQIALEVASILQKPISLVENVSASDVPNASPVRSKSECLGTIYEENKLRHWKEALREYIYKYISTKNIDVETKAAEKQLWKTREKCRLCDNYNLHTFFNLESTPPANHFIPIKEYQKTIPLTLAKCKNCSHIQLMEIIEPSYLYSNYLYLSSISPTMTKHLKNTVSEFVKRFEVDYDDNILEIGANDGTCIKELIDMGYKNTIGIDPAKNINNLHNLPIICDFFGSNILNNPNLVKKYKLIYAFHCCAHIENIQDVFQTVYKLLDDDGVFIVEVGYFNEVVKQNNFDVIYHEHIDYHTCYAMNNFCKNNNLTLFDVAKNNIQSGSIQFFISKSLFKREISNNVEDFIQDEFNNNIFNIDYLNLWKSNIIKSAEEFNHLIYGLVQQGNKIAGYGASAKSNTFLHQCKMNNMLIHYIIDDNNLKQNKFTPGLHIPIKSRDYLQINHVDYIVILAWNFVDDIVKLLKSQIDKGTQIIVPFPKFKIL